MGKRIYTDSHTIGISFNFTQSKLTFEINKKPIHQLKKGATDDISPRRTNKYNFIWKSTSLDLGKSKNIHTRSQHFNRKSLFSDAYTNNRKNPSADVERLLLFWHYCCFGSFKALRDRKHRILDLFTLRIQSFPFFIHREILERPTSRRTSESSASSYIIIHKVHFHFEFDCRLYGDVAGSLRKYIKIYFRSFFGIELVF